MFKHSFECLNRLRRFLNPTSWWTKWRRCAMMLVKKESQVYLLLSLTGSGLLVVDSRRMYLSKSVLFLNRIGFSWICYRFLRNSLHRGLVLPHRHYRDLKGISVVLTAWKQPVIETHLKGVLYASALYPVPIFLLLSFWLFNVCIFR